MVRKYVRIIAIDPDVEKSGVAELHVKTRNMNITKLSFPLLVDYLQYMKEMCINKMKEDVLVIVEAGWLNHSNWHLNYSDNKRIAAAKGNSTGRNHETGRKIVEMAKHIGFEVEEVKPLKKLWKGRDGKITQEELENIIGPLNVRLSQDSRDAALLAWWYAGLPVKMRV